MPLKIGNDIFGLDNRPGEAEEAQREEAIEPREAPAEKPKVRYRPKVEHKKSRKQKESKVSCTFWLEESVRNELQGAAFLLSKPQNQIVEEAVAKYIKSKGLKIPKKVA